MYASLALFGKDKWCAGNEELLSGFREAPRIGISFFLRTWYINGFGDEGVAWNIH